MSKVKYYLSFFLGICAVLVVHTSIEVVAAQTSEVERLQGEISQKNNRLSEIEKEIAQYEASLKEVGAEKTTLQKAINQLTLERKKVQADIRYTENKISSTDLEINKLSLEIGVTQKTILHNEDAIRSILRKMNIADSETLIEILLRHSNISEFWNAIEELETVKQSMSTRIEELSDQKKKLEDKKVANTEKREDLLELKSQFNDQQSILTSNTATKSELLSATKNEEKEYQAMLKARKAAKEKLQAEVQDIESQLKFILDPTTIPSAGTAVLRWPLEKPYITQYFGYTKFALQSGAYKNNMHNGMDLGAAVGTKIFAPLTGTVRMTGNTDLVPGCYSWGKWALVDHPNGLSSMFAHMSQIAVSPGQKVNTGDIVGYVGNTGYSTGPHLHFTLYVKAGVEVKPFNQFKSVTGCGAALSPFAAIDAYLDPLDYLPAL
jgi:murein DD-endopeptidase MepM/ murein hydrolase activator NlpD